MAQDQGIDVDQKGEHHLRCHGEVGYPFFGQLILDCLNRTENAMTQELSSLDRSNQKKIETWRQKGNQMTQAEGEQAQQEYQQMQQQFASRKQNLEQELYKSTESLKTNIRKTIENYLKDYNKQKSFSYIIQYDANSFIYTKDSVYDITTDLVDGLNAAYKKK